jgi:phage tail-like protein
MDANGTRYQLLMGEDDWGSCTLEDGVQLKRLWSSSPPVADTAPVYWDSQRNELSLLPQLYAIAAPHTQRLEVGDRRGAAQDRYGNWYWIAADRKSIQVNSSGSGTTSLFWAPGIGAASRMPASGGFQAIDPPAAPVVLALSGLTVTDDHYLVAGVVDPPGLLRFDLHAGAAPVQLYWPKKVAFAPFDMSPAPCGGVWILDRDNARYWPVSRHFQISPACPVKCSDPVAIIGLPDHTVLILDTPALADFSNIHRYRDGQEVGHPVSTAAMQQLIEDDEEADFTLPGYDFAFVPDTLFVASTNGKQSFAFNLGQQGDQLTLDPLPDFYPMHQFGGKALVATASGPYYDFGDRWIPLVAQRRPRYETQGAIVTRAFDGREPNCTWHRLLLDVAIPAEADVLVWSRASDDANTLAAADWQREPELYRRDNGSELPYAPEPSACSLPLGTWELLFQRAQGRYLQMKLELTGSGRVTPRLYALRAWYPRFSYLAQYLPAVYRDANAESASFLDRFLANMEGTNTAVEDKIAAVQALFDARSAPADTLDWLASWFQVALDPAWDESRRRLFLRHAMDFFQYRGTMVGMKWALRLALDPCADPSMFSQAATHTPDSIRIVEKFRLRQTPGVVFGDPTASAALKPVRAGTRWLPSRGRAALNAAYGGAYPLQAPADSAQAAAWTQFSQNTLGFIPSTDSSLASIWQAFLERRYGHVSALNAAWLLASPQAFSDFPQISLPTTLPPDGAALVDWFQFQAVVLPTRSLAHQFSILLPAPKTDSPDQAEHQRRLGLAQRVADLEKPAHTSYEIKFYWATFRLGDSRLGTDTLLDFGSRSPQLMPPLWLGQNALAESYLAPNYPWDIAERQILGRQRLTQTFTSWQEGQS